MCCAGCVGANAPDWSGAKTASDASDLFDELPPRVPLPNLSLHAVIRDGRS